MNKLYAYLMLLAVLTGMPMNVQAASAPTCTSGEYITCYHLTVGNLAGVVSAGDFELSTTYPHTVSEMDSVVYVLVSVSGPGVTSASVTYNPSSLSGCTIANGATTQTSQTSYYQASAIFLVTMIETQCNALIRYTLSGGLISTQIADYYLPVTIKSSDGPTNSFHWDCGNTGATPVSFVPNAQTCNLPQSAMCNYTGLANTITSTPCNMFTSANYQFGCAFTSTSAQANSPSTSTCILPSNAINLFDCGGGVGRTGEFTPPAYVTCASSHADGDSQTVVSSGIRFVGPPSLVRIPNTGAAMTIPSSFVAYVPPGVVPTTMNAGSGPWTPSCTVGTITGSTAHGIAPDYNTWTASPTVTMAIGANTCEARFEVQLLSGSTVLATAEFVTLYIRDFQQVQNHVCGASDFTSCPTLSVNEAITGSITLSGTLGTQHLVIDSWPSLVASVTNSGTQTLNIQNSVGQTFAISGNINTATTGDLTVTNQGHQSIDVTSWPQLTALLTQSQPWNVNLGSGFNASLNITGILNAMRIVATLCGGPVDNDTTQCNPLTLKSSANNGSQFWESEFFLVLIIAAIMIFTGEITHDNVTKILAAVVLIFDDFVLHATYKTLNMSAADAITLGTILACYAIWLTSHLIISGRFRSD